MKRKKITKLLAIVMLATVINYGVGGSINNNWSIEREAYADTVGMQTSDGVVSKYVKYADDLLENRPMQELVNKSEKITNESHPDLFYYVDTNSYWELDISKMGLTGKTYHSSYLVKYPGGEVTQDNFIKILSMEPKDIAGGVKRVYTKVVYINGNFSYIERNGIREDLDFDAYNYMIDEVQSGEVDKPAVDVPVTPDKPTTDIPATETPVEQAKIYSSARLGGINRYSTALNIAREFKGGPLDNVIIGTGLDFPDSLSGSNLSAQYNAPILLVNNTVKASKDTLDYIKNNLKKDGKVFILGGTGVVSDDFVQELMKSGYTNFERLGGINRYETNRIINNKLENSPAVIIASGNDFADALSASGVSGIGGMPIYLANKGELDINTQNDIKRINPSKIYIVGGTGVVSTNTENLLKGITPDVTRLGGATRYETSLEVAKHFKLDTKSAIIATALDFPDALTGSALAIKENAPIILVNKDVTKQKEYLDSTKITDLYILGGDGVITNSVVDSLKK